MLGRRRIWLSTFCFVSRFYVFCISNHVSGQLGSGSTDDIGATASFGSMGNNLSVIDLGTGFNATKVSGGGDHSCALSTQYEVRCWGRNKYGELVE